MRLRRFLCKLRVKLVGGNNTEFIADSHQFPCKFWEVSGRMFDVLTRTSKQGNDRAADIVVSRKRVEEIFPTETGYVDYIDESHGHIHVYDALSRHFVAETKSVSPDIRVQAGCFVSFCPIIIEGDRFKSAAIISVMDGQTGIEAFGTYMAKVEYVNVQEAYFRYAIETEIKPTPEGTVTPTGFASMASLSDDLKIRIAVGLRVRLLLFLKRGKDGKKHNYVAQVYMV